MKTPSTDLDLHYYLLYSHFITVDFRGSFPDDRYFFVLSSSVLAFLLLIIILLFSSVHNVLFYQVVLFHFLLL